MPSNSSSPHWYSWDMGPAHFIRCNTLSPHTQESLLSLYLSSYSTEVYFYSYFSGWGISQQLKWLQEDLAKAQTNRAERPWIIAYGHRPMYCSNLNRDDCTTPKSVVRAGYVRIYHFLCVYIMQQVTTNFQYVHFSAFGTMCFCK